MLAAEARQRFEQVLNFCQQREYPFFQFEKCLFALMAVLGRLLIRLHLTARHERLDLEPFLEDGLYRRGNPYAERTLKTAYGEVKYGRTHLIQRKGGAGFYPLDAMLVLTRDKLSPWVMQLVGRLATRMSYASTRLLCQAMLRWSPSTERLSKWCWAWAGMQRPSCSSWRRRPMMVRCWSSKWTANAHRRRRLGSCANDAANGGTARVVPAVVSGIVAASSGKPGARKKRRKKGDNGKNGKEVLVVVMYTLKRG